MNLNILNEIDIEQNISEINVLYSICESYNKMIQIITETDNTSIIQECVVFQEADTVKTDDKKSIKDYFLSILSKVFNAIRILLTKIIDFLSKIFIKKRDSYIAVVNCLMILDAFQHVNVTSVITESNTISIEFDDDVWSEYNTDEIIDTDKLIQEGWYTSPYGELRYREAEARIAEATGEKSINITYDKIEKGLKRFYNVEIRHKIMSKKDVTDLVKALCAVATPEALNEIKNVIKKIENGDEIKKLSQEAQGYVEFITEFVDEKNQQKWKEICDVRRTQCKTYEQADAELRSMEALVNGVGKTIGKLTNQRITGSKNAVMDVVSNGEWAGVKSLGRAVGDAGAIVGGAVSGVVDKAVEGVKSKGGVKSTLQGLANTLYSSMTQVPTALGKIKQYIVNIKHISDVADDAVKGIKKVDSVVSKPLANTGKQLRSDYENFQKVYHEEDDKLKELGQRSTNLINSVKFCGDGLGEETFIIHQDTINNDVYVPENIHSPKDVVRVIAKKIYSGPCTAVFRLLKILAPFYIGWAVATAQGLNQKQAVTAGFVTLSTKNIKKITVGLSELTVKKVFKSLTGDVLVGYAARKMTGDLNTPTPTMAHDAKMEEQERLAKEAKRQEKQNRPNFADRVFGTLDDVRNRVNNTSSVKERD